MPFRRFFKRFSVDADEQRARQIGAWAETVPGVVRIADAEPRSVARVAGVVESLRVRPREGVQAIEAVLTDGSGTVTAVWLGRRMLPGLSLGSKLIVEGRFGGERSRLQVMNPQFEFAAPEH
jgi:RecG-like helicase